MNIYHNLKDGGSGSFCVPLCNSAILYFDRVQSIAKAIEYIFSVAGDLTTLSILAAAKIADRIGLINTMVFTHIPSNLLLIMVGFAPSDRTSHRPTQLSGGEQQRVAIARALVNDPPLVLADEPTGNLDDENARAVLDLLTQACLERGKTLILVAHDLSALHKVDRVLELRAGSLRAHPISS